MDWLFQKMVRGMSGAGSTGGAVVTAISGVELALWDLKGQALGTPIYNLLGGRYRDAHPHLRRLRARRSRPRPHGPRRALQGMAGGYTALKFDIDNVPGHRAPRALERPTAAAGLGGHQCPARGRWTTWSRLVGAVREAVGPQIELALDCHWDYTPATPSSWPRSSSRCA